MVREGDEDAYVPFFLFQEMNGTPSTDAASPIVSLFFQERWIGWGSRIVSVPTIHALTHARTHVDDECVRVARTVQGGGKKYHGGRWLRKGKGTGGNAIRKMKEQPPLHTHKQE